MLKPTIQKESSKSPLIFLEYQSPLLTESFELRLSTLCTNGLLTFSQERYLRNYEKCTPFGYTVHLKENINAKYTFHPGGPKWTAGQTPVTTAQDDWRGCFYHKRSRHQTCADSSSFIWLCWDMNPKRMLETPKSLVSNVQKWLQIHAWSHTYTQMNILHPSMII